MASLRGRASATGRAPSTGRAKTALVIVALLVAVIAAAHGTQRGNVHVVEIRGFAFAPDTLEVAAGDTVVWRNRDFAPHTATSELGRWGSPSLQAGESWRTVVTAGGAYRCTLHPSMRGMLVLR